MRYARSGPAMTVLTDGRVLVVGSSASDITGVDARAFSTAEIWDPATGRFSSAGRLPPLDRAALEQPGHNPIPEEPPAPASTGWLQPLPDGGALLVAQIGWWKHVGDLTRSFRYDAAANTWREVGDTYVYVGEPTRNVLVTDGVPWLQGVAVFTSPDGRVIRAGGNGPAVRLQNGYTNQSMAAADAYDPGTDAWLPLPPMPAPREWVVPVTVADGSTLLLGGWMADSDGSSEVAPVRFVPGS
jgi:hypothetical protein